MKPIDWTVTATDGLARTGILRTRRSVIETPVFMPVGTQGTVKGVRPEWLENELDARIILGNTYHLWLRPGMEIIRAMGGLHKFSGWNRSLLTDSGGFQVFSLTDLRKLNEDGVEFRSHLDGDLKFLSPEVSMEIQAALGAEIAMVFDECPPGQVARDEAKKSLDLTIRWAQRSKDKFNELQVSELPASAGSDISGNPYDTGRLPANAGSSDMPAGLHTNCFPDEKLPANAGSSDMPAGLHTNCFPDEELPADAGSSDKKASADAGSSDMPAGLHTNCFPDEELPANAGSSDKKLPANAGSSDKKAPADAGSSDLSGRQALFGIIQGAAHLDLRKESLERTVEIGFDGYAIGGLSVGEEKPVMYEVIENVAPNMPADAPRYLMGVGTPEDLVEAVARGVDMFDCVMPTRNGRTGQAFTSRGKVNIRNARYARDPEPLDPDCACSVCGRYSRAYLRHLYQAGEMLAATLLSHHNLAFYLDTMRRVRQSIQLGQFDRFRREFLERLRAADEQDPV